MLREGRTGWAGSPHSVASKIENVKRGETYELPCCVRICAAAAWAWPLLIQAAGFWAAHVHTRHSARLLIRAAPLCAVPFWSCCCHGRSCLRRSVLTTPVRDTETRERIREGQQPVSRCRVSRVAQKTQAVPGSRFQARSKSSRLRMSAKGNTANTSGSRFQAREGAKGSKGAKGSRLGKEQSKQQASRPELTPCCSPSGVNEGGTHEEEEEEEESEFEHTAAHAGGDSSKQALPSSLPAPQPGWVLWRQFTGCVAWLWCLCVAQQHLQEKGPEHPTQNTCAQSRFERDSAARRRQGRGVQLGCFFGRKFGLAKKEGLRLSVENNVFACAFNHLLW